MPLLLLGSAPLLSFCEMTLAPIPEPLRGYFPTYSENVRSELEDLEPLALPEVCEKRAERFPVSGARPQDYRERALQLNGTGWAIAGIRFRSLRLDFPFVEVVLNFPPSAERLSQLASVVKKEFAVFCPKGMMFRSAPGLSFPSTEEWDHVVWSRLPTDSKPERLPVGFELRRETNLQFYNHYNLAYQSWRDEHPDLALVVRQETEESLGKSLSENLLFGLYKDASWVGAVALRAKPLYGGPAVYVVEKSIAASFRGQGLAPRTEGAALQEVATTFPAVWGKINSRNIPSLRSAFRQGRQIIETEYFWKF